MVYRITGHSVIQVYQENRRIPARRDPVRHQGRFRTGRAQVGKTTLVEHVAGGHDALFLNFDLEVDKARFLAAASLPPADALRSFDSPPLLVVDEAQRLPEAARIVKGWPDPRLLVLDPVTWLLLAEPARPGRREPDRTQPQADPAALAVR